MKLFFALLLAFGLTGCLDAEFLIDVENESVTTTYVESRKLYDMRDKHECVGESHLDEEAFTCVATAPFDLERAIEGDWGSVLTPGATSATKNPFTITKVGRRTYRLEFDTTALGDPEKNPANDPQMEDLMPMIEASMAGHSIVIKIEGVNVRDTNGEVYNDGHAVKFVTPLVHVLRPEREAVPRLFYAEFRTR